MIDLVTHIELTTSTPEMIEIGVDAEWNVHVRGDRDKVLHPIAGLALAVLINNVNTYVPKADMPNMIGGLLGMENYLDADVFDGVNTLRGASNGVTRRLNQLKRRYRDTFGASIMHLGKSPDAKWILVQDVSDEDGVFDLLRSQGDLSKEDVRSIRKIHADDGASGATLRGIYGADASAPRFLVPATREQKQQFFNLLTEGDLESTITRSELSDWVRQQGVSGIPVDDLILVALGKGYVAVGPNSDDTVDPHEVTYVRK